MANEIEGKIDLTSGEMTYVENTTAPELYADQASYFFLKNGSVSITLTSFQLAGSVEPPHPVRRVVVGRLTMSAKGAGGLALGLYNFLVSNGLAPQGDTKGSN